MRARASWRRSRPTFGVATGLKCGLGRAWVLTIRDGAIARFCFYQERQDGLLITENGAYMRGRDGIEVQARSAWLITIRDGEQTSLSLYQTKQEALEAAGLSE